MSWDNTIAYIFGQNVPISGANIFVVITLIALPILTFIVYIACVYFLKPKYKRTIENYSDILNIINDIEQIKNRNKEKIKLSVIITFIVFVSIFVASYFLFISGANPLTALFFIMPSLVVLILCYKNKKLEMTGIPKQFMCLEKTGG